MAKLPNSVQLYTLRDAVSKDFAGTLKKLSQIGYKAGELAGYGDLKTAAETRKAFDANGMVVSGMHVGLDAFKKDTNAVIADAKTLGCQNVILPYIDPNTLGTHAEWRTFAATCQNFGKLVTDAGLTFAYHNHDFEFRKYENEYAMDIFLQHSDPKAVKIELDLYWVSKGGLDPVAYLKQLGNRVVLVHLKDKTADGKFAPVGTGTLDFKALTDTAAGLGVRYGVVEQDDCYGKDPFECVATSFENLKKIGVV